MDRLERLRLLETKKRYVWKYGRIPGTGPLRPRRSKLLDRATPGLARGRKQARLKTLRST